MKIDIPFDLEMPYEYFEFVLEPISDRFTGFDSYKYLGCFYFHNACVNNIELIFYWDFLKIIILEIDCLSIDLEKQLEQRGYINIKGLFIKTNLRHLDF